MYKADTVSRRSKNKFEMRSGWPSDWSIQVGGWLCGPATQPAVGEPGQASQADFQCDGCGGRGDRV